MNSLEEYVGELGNKLSKSFEAESFSELKESLFSMVDELTVHLKADPLQTIAAGVALGYFAASFIRSKGRPLSRNIGRGVGAAVASRIFEKVTSAKSFDYGIDKDVRH